MGINCDDASNYQVLDKTIFDRNKLSQNTELATGSYSLSADLDLIAFRTKYEKQWRHSYKASYAIFTTHFFDSPEGGAELKFVGEIKDVWYFAFEPAPQALDPADNPRRKFVFVDEAKNLHYGQVGADAKMIQKSVPFGDDATPGNGIYNGVPDWVYEEEMLSSRSATWWSPNGDNLVFVKFKTAQEENVEYNVYSTSSDQAGRADDFLVQKMDDRYPQVESIPYSKPGGEIASYEVYSCSNLVAMDAQCSKIEEVEKDPANPDKPRNNALFAKVSFTKDIHLDQSNSDIGSLFYIITQNRIGSASSYLECYYLDSKLECKEAETLAETTFDDGLADFTGWVDSSSIWNDPYISQAFLFRIAYVRDECNSFQVYDKVNKKTYDLIDGKGVCMQSVQSIGRPIYDNAKKLTTDYSIRFYASVPGKSWERHVYQINYKALTENPDSWEPIPFEKWQCLTCYAFGEPKRNCNYAALSLSTEREFGMFSCYGPDVPFYLNMYLPKLENESSNQQIIIPGITPNSPHELNEETTETNQKLIKNLETKAWPSVSYGTFKSDKFPEIPFNYELYVPDGIKLEESKSGSIPLLIEIYGGPGSTKVNAQWKRSYTQTYMASKHNIVVAAVDGRGSGRKGNKMMHATYKENQIGQFEREDVSDFAGWLLNKYMALDSSRVGIWGWSFGGYATTHTLLYPGTVFTTGVAVAPLVSRYNYDSMHTERFMAMPEDNQDNYDKCSLLSQNITQMHDKQYTIISGTMDDNVHFQNSALISKALFKEGVEFNAMFYGDEAHSIRYGRGNNKHIYRVITRQFLKYFGLPDDEKDSWNA